MRKHGDITVYWKEARRGWYYRVQIDGKRVEKSCGVSQNSKAGRETALKKARAIASALQGGDEMALAEAVRRPGYATLGEVADIYSAHGPAKSKTKTLSRFVLYAREATGREDWRERSCEAALSAEALRRWITAQERAGRSKNGIHSDVSQIKSVVARKRIHLFKDMKLPDLTEFWSVTGGSTKTEGYQPIDRSVLRRMDAAARIPLRKQNPRVWAIYWLMRKAGLRNEEIEDLKWAWVEWKDKKTAVLVLVERDCWTPKGRSGRVPVRARLMRLIHRALGGGEYVIPRKHKTEAHDLTHYDINDFVRQFLPEGNKGAYNLRKEYGAMIALRDGIEVASRLLRHSDISTTYRHYHNLIDEPEPL